MIYNIDANLLFEVMGFYKSLDYKLCSCPLVVDKDVSDFTKPQDRGALHHIGGKYFVGSAEQGFLQMIKDNDNLNKNMLFITPCHRDEDVKDESHLEIFIKVELISLVKNPIEDVIKMYNIILNTNPEIVKTKDGCDLEINNIEVGSYGKNSYLGVEYYYGTGLALPRLEYALNKDFDLC